MTEFGYGIKLNRVLKKKVFYFLFVLLCLFLMLTGCSYGNASNNRQGQQGGDTGVSTNGTGADKTSSGIETGANQDVSTLETESVSREREYILKKIDASTESVYLYSRSTGKELKYKYCLTTRFLNRSGKQISSLHFKPGAVVTLGDFYADNGAVSYVQLADGIWDQTDITKFSIDEERGVFTIGSTNYKLTDDTVIFSDDKKIKVSDITKKDILRVSGRDKELYSVTVTTGHGYVQLVNSSLFVNSVICIGNKNMALIDGDMIIEVPEGTYDITVANDGWGGTGSYEVVRGETTMVDLDELKGDGPSYCRLKFEVWVDYANVFLDGELVDVSEPMEVRYGRHSLRVSCVGYTDWSRTLFVNSPTATISLDLADESTSSSSDNSSNSSSASNENSGSNSGSNNNSNNNSNSSTTNNSTTNNSTTNNTGNNSNSTDKTDAELDYLTTISNLLSNML